LKSGAYLGIDFEDALNKRRLADTGLKEYKYSLLRCSNNKPNVSDEYNPKPVANERFNHRENKEAHFGQEESDSSTFEGKSGVFRSISGSRSMTESIEVVVEEEKETR